jgi:hypothetical protein
LLSSQKVGKSSLVCREDTRNNGGPSHQYKRKSDYAHWATLNFYRFNFANILNVLLEHTTRCKDWHGHGLTGCPSTIIRKGGCGSDFSWMSNGLD